MVQWTGDAPAGRCAPIVARSVERPGRDVVAVESAGRHTIPAASDVFFHRVVFFLRLFLRRFRRFPAPPLVTFLGFRATDFERRREEIRSAV